MRAQLALGAVLVCALHSVVAQDVLADNSFRPPFNTYDGEGKRLIPNFSYGGNVDVNENFIRLTPDRASKRGWLWSRNTLGDEQWTATLRFRVSGQGKRLFGDGFAFWFTQNRFHADGQLHGFTDKFTGFGVVFDTFRNAELSHLHKDVAVYINDGASLDITSLKSVIGCDADFRWWEGRDDFTVLNKSVAKITFSKGSLSVDIDARNNGEFKSCVKDVPISLPAGWFANAYVGVTATTGQLADNHDVLSLLISKGTDVAPEKDAVPDVPLPSTGNEQLDNLVKQAVLKEITAVTDKLTNLHHSLEHQLSAVNDALQNNIKKLQEQDANNVKRITDLETKLHMKVDSDVSKHVANAVESSLEGRLEVIEQSMKAKFDNKLDNELAPKLEKAVEKQLEGSGGGWKLPFFLLIAIIGGLVAFAYQKYRHLMKTHLL